VGSVKDEFIIQQIRNRNPDGLAALIEKYKRLSCSVALSIVGSSNLEDALECVNQAFYDIWESCSKLDENKSSLKGWVCLITRRRAIDCLRRKNRGQDLVLDDFTEILPSTRGNPEDEMDRKELAALLNQFILGLPDMDRTVFLRRFFLLESISEIAESQGVSRAAVDNRLKRIRSKLRVYLERSS
jgi:RNA polymerase sigma-70 factor (ECF subfamily)